MRVLFLTNVPSPYRVDFFNKLGDLCELTVLFESDKAKNRNCEWMAKGNKNFKSVFMKGIKVGDAEAFCPKVVKYLSKKKYDFIIVGLYSSPTGMLAIEYMKMRNIPFILNSDGGYIKSESKFNYFIKRHFISAASYWLSTGKITSDYFSYYGADKRKIYVYPFTSTLQNEILSKPLNNEEKKMYKKKLGMNENKIVLSVGQFIHRKGYDLLLNSCKNLNKDIGIYIVGGEATEEYKKIKEKFNLTNVHFVGFKKKSELAQYYKAADLFVLPTREDIWGLVINEAMSYGLPVLTTERCVAGLEMINDKDCICDVNVDWTEKIENTIKREDYNLLCENNLKTAKKYTIENMAREHFAILNLIGDEL